MIYNLLRPLVRITFYFFYRKIYLSGRDKVPSTGPLIITANHPTAFIDPCFLACFSGRTLFFITRGDIFINQWVSWLLSLVHLIPIYRFVDGYKGLRKNSLSLDKAKQIIAKGGAVLIMAEGRMGHEKFLRTIQKGAARIGFEAMVDYGLPELMIQPVGINYTYGHMARTEIMVEFAPPFPLSPYYDLYVKNPKEAIALVTARIESDLQERVIHINKNRDERTAEHILQLIRHQTSFSFWPILIRGNQLLKKELSAMAAFNRMDHQELKEWKRRLSGYFRLIKDFHLSDRIVAKGDNLKVISKWRYFIIRGLKWVCIGPHILPRALAIWITQETVKTIEFRSSVLMGTAMFVWLIYSATLCICMYRFGSGIAMFIGLTILVGTGLFWLWLDIIETAWHDRLQWHRLTEAERSTCLKERRTLIEQWMQYQKSVSN